jgi:pimeloyl-ACP methyl ester carboxylesterase
VSNTDDPEMGYRFLEALAESTVNGERALPERVGMVREGRPMARFSPFGLSRGRNTTAERWLRLLRTTSARGDFTAPAGLTVDSVREVRQPTLAIFGEQSHCLVSYRKLRKTIPNCQGILVPGAGHFHPVVRPLFFARAVSRFIEGVNPATPRPTDGGWVESQR